MIWWRKRKEEKVDARSAVIHALPPHIKTVFAIGDVHGMIDLARKAEMKIADDYDFDPDTTLILYLGDLVDRGPETAFLLDWLLVRSKTGAERMFLRGNHEEMMEAFLNDPGQHMNWLDFGGYETLNSYGIMQSHKKLHNMRAKDLTVLLQTTISDSHRRFIADTIDAIESESFLFVHAGVVPDLPIAKQSRDDFLWARDRFMAHEGGFEKTIVHGHTPVKTARYSHDRVSVDTGAYQTGRLTVAKIAIETNSVEFIVVTDSSD